MTNVRGHHEGTLFQRSRDKRWVAMVTMPDGRRRSASARSKAEGVRLLEDLKRQRDAQMVDPRNLTLGTYLRRWLDDVRPSMAPETWRKHESACRVHIGPILGDVRLSGLSVGDVRRFLAQEGQGQLLARRADAQTVRHWRATLRRALADAVREGLIARNVAALAEAPRLSHRERTVLTADQVRALIEGTRDDRLGPLWTLAATTGMRLGEMLALTWEDIELDAHPSVTVHATLHRIHGEWQRRDPKTEKSRRVVPLPAVTVEALRRIRRLHGLVFTTDKGYPLHGSNLPKELHKATDRLGLPRVGIHDLRHSAATILFASGLPIEAIADLLGHSTVRVTQDLYRHRVQAFSELAAQRMQEAVG